MDHPLTVAQVAVRLNKSPRQVRDDARAGRFPGAEQVTPRLWLIPEAAVEQYRQWAAGQVGAPGRTPRA